MPAHKLSDKIGKKITQDYLSGMNFAELSRKYGVYPNVIRVAIKRQGVEPTSNVSFYQFNKHVFDNLHNEHACYWLGFIFADGYVNNEGLKLQLKLSDKSHLKKFKTFMEAEQPLYRADTVAKGKTYKRIAIGIYRKEFANKLRDLGLFANRNDSSIALNNIPVNMRSHWFRGLFDGDGCAHRRPTLTFLAPEPVLHILKEELAERKLMACTKQAPNGPTITTRKGKIHRINFGGINQSRSIANEYLYKNATIWLERKRNIINSWTSASRYN